MIKANRHALSATLLAIGLFAAWPAADSPAQERKLSASEIEAKLIGNTIQGVWYDEPYRQFFDGSGNTLYAEEGRSPALGQWWVDEEKGLYCSTRQGGRQACYEVLDGGPNTIIWAEPGSGRQFPAEVLEGDQLSKEVQRDPIF